MNLDNTAHPTTDDALPKSIAELKTAVDRLPQALRSKFTPLLQQAAKSLGLLGTADRGELIAILEARLPTKEELWLCWNYFEQSRLTRSALALQMGLTTKHMNRILFGQKPVTSQFRWRLLAVLNGKTIPAPAWRRQVTTEITVHDKSQYAALVKAGTSGELCVIARCLEIGKARARLSSRNGPALIVPLDPSQPFAAVSITFSVGGYALELLGTFERIAAAKEFCDQHNRTQPPNVRATVLPPPFHAQGPSPQPVGADRKRPEPRKEGAA